ncbi:uncharacterized protein F5891DRAFT_1016541 [Suillus fuscotomentosus]|uniref:Secreted protein n=1 Tax=Suillus fuscotomentosus TaxID=1912939 RepID=A0AAD4EDE7_9AGAM|nr:uncharacterized protein F5891DRAFT_1016541 [Suillus fuscotomentosus]KAG1904085.1 hypothetical protein F5891DRAFT_1016541 [Suillus fuscotomentosus]
MQLRGASEVLRLSLTLLIWHLFNELATRRYLRMNHNDFGTQVGERCRRLKWFCPDPVLGLPRSANFVQILINKDLL